MQKCSTCGQKFSYKQLIDSISKNYKPLSCTKCRETFTVSIWSRLIISFLIVGMVFVNFPWDQPLYVKLAVFLLHCAVILLISPFIVRYKKVVEEDD